MALAKAERVARGDLGTAMRRPGRPALGPAPPLPGPSGVPVCLVGKAARPPAGARVVGEPGVDLVNEPGPWLRRRPPAAELPDGREARPPGDTGAGDLGPLLRCQARSSRRCPGTNWPNRRDKNVHLLVGSARRP